MKITAAVLAFLCCLVVISGLNKPHLSPFRTAVDMNYPVAVARSDSGTVIIDGQCRRMLITDSEQSLTAVVDTTLAGSPVDKVHAVAMYGERIFAIGSTHFYNGVYVSSESVIEYDLRGRVVRTLYSQQYPEEDRISCEQFTCLMADDDGLCLTLADRTTVTALRIGDCIEPLGCWELPEPVYSAGYIPPEGEGIVIGTSKNCYYIQTDGKVEAVSFADYLRDLLAYYHVTDNGIDLSVFDNCYCIPSIEWNADGEAQYFCVVSPEDELLLVLSNDTSVQVDIASIPYSTGMMIQTVIYWLSIALLAAAVLGLLLWYLIKKWNRRTGISVLIIGSIILTSLFYNRQLQTVAKNSYRDALVTQTKQISFTLSKCAGDLYAEIRDGGISAYCSSVANQEEIAELGNVLKTLCDANKPGQSCCAFLYLMDSDGQLYTFADSCGANMSGQPVFLSEDAEQILTESDHQPVTVKTYSETFVYDYDFIRDTEGDIVGVLSVSGLRGNLRYVQVQNTVNMTVGLTALVVGVYMLLTLVKTFSADLRRRRARAPSDVEGKRLDMAGIFSFGQGIICGLDSVIVVYVAKSLCEESAPELQATLTALPLALETVGALIGMSLAAFFERRTGERRCAVLSTVLTAVGMLVSALAVSLGNICLYSVGKFLIGLFFGGVAYTMALTLPHRTGTAEARQPVLGSVLSGSFAAAIISALVGGYTAQYLSYSSIYLLGAVLCVLFIVPCILSFAQKTPEETANRRPVEHSAGRVRYRMFFLRGPGLVYLLFYTVPFIIVSGYRSYLFPLYAAGSGISALLLSNLTVFVRTFTFIILGRLKKLCKGRDPATVMVVPMLVVCACLVCFVISPNVYWAILMLLIFEMMMRTRSGAAWSYMTGQAEANHLDGKTVYGRYLSIETAVRVFQSPVLSVFVMLGMNLACTAAGAFCGILFVIFGIYNKRRRNAAVSIPATVQK